jgi:hypothetical protein
MVGSNGSKMDAETVAAIDGLRTEWRTELRTECAAIRAEIADARRHALVLHETLRDDIRMIAAGFASLSVRFDAIDKRFDAIEMRLDTVEIELMSHGHQLRTLHLKVDTLHRPH